MLIATDNPKVPPVPPCKEGPSKEPHPAKFPLVDVDILIFTLPNLAQEAACRVKQQSILLSHLQGGEGVIQ